MPLTGEPKPELLIWKEVSWRGAGNLYDVKSLRVDQATFNAQTFGEFQKLTASENDSQWSAPTVPSVEVGADEASLRRLIPTHGP